MTRVFLNLIGNGFYAATKRARGNGEAGYRPTLHVSTRDSNCPFEKLLWDQLVDTRYLGRGRAANTALRDETAESGILGFHPSRRGSRRTKRRPPKPPLLATGILSDRQRRGRLKHPLWD